MFRLQVCNALFKVLYHWTLFKKDGAHLCYIDPRSTYEWRTREPPEGDMLLFRRTHTVNYTTTKGRLTPKPSGSTRLSWQYIDFFLWSQKPYIMRPTAACGWRSYHNIWNVPAVPSMWGSLTLAPITRHPLLQMHINSIIMLTSPYVPIPAFVVWSTVSDKPWGGNYEAANYEAQWDGVK